MNINMQQGNRRIIIYLHLPASRVGTVGSVGVTGMVRIVL